MSIPPVSAIGGRDIPLDNLRLLLGRERETQLVNNTIANEAALDSARRLSGAQVDVSVHDSLRISAVQSDGVQIAEWIVDVDAWRVLNNRSNGDDISGSGDSVLVLSDVGTIRIGRTAGGRVLVQRGSFTTAQTNFFLNVHARLYDGGLLERRIANLRVNPVRDAVLKQRSATTPAAPTGFTFDATGQITPGSDGWILATQPDPAATSRSVNVRLGWAGALAQGALNVASPAQFYADPNEPNPPTGPISWRNLSSPYAAVALGSAITIHRASGAPDIDTIDLATGSWIETLTA